MKWDEDLIQDAMRGEDQALKLLENRLKLYIRHMLRGYCDEEEMEELERRILEKVFNSLQSYGYTVTFRTWVERIAWNICPKLCDGDTKTRNILVKAPPMLKNGGTGSKHPPLNLIDPEVRFIVYLLNKSPYIQTFSSCSGHPKSEERWTPLNEGWISFKTIGDQRKGWDLLNHLFRRLDNSSSVNFQLYKEAGAEELFRSSVPIFVADVYFELFPDAEDFDDRLMIWRHILASAKGFIQYTEEDLKGINTPYSAAELLKEGLRSLPYILHVRISGRDYPRLRVKWFRMEGELCRMCSDWVDKIYESLGDSRFSSDWLFTIRPLVESAFIQRSREDHMRIWKLIEAAIREFICRCN